MFRLVNGFLIAAQFVGAESGAVNVCTAARGGTAGGVATVIIRGTGQVLDDGLALASASCPIAKTAYDDLPTVILVKVTSFATPDARNRFVRAESEKGRLSPMLDVEARGRLNCRARMRFIRSGPDIVGANGFGTLGLYKCMLDSAELLQIADSKVQPEQSSAPKPK